MMEYRIHRLDHNYAEKELNDLARRGWRLITVTMRHDGVETAYLEREIRVHPLP